MNKARLLLLPLLPMVAGAFYLRSLASWRPRLVFQHTPFAISHLVFSNDGQTLLVAQGRVLTIARGNAMVSFLSALDTQAGFARKWQREWPWKSNPAPALHGKRYMLARGFQFLQRDAHVLIDGNLELLEAGTGKPLLSFATDQLATLSPDEAWLTITDPVKSYSARGVGVSRYRLQVPGAVSQVRVVPQVKGVAIPSSYTRTFSFSPDGKRFALAIGDRQGVHLDFYDANTWKRTGSWSDWKGPSSPQKMPYYLSVQWSPNSAFLLSWWRAPSTLGVSLWRVRDGKKLASRQWTRSGSGAFAGYRAYEVQNDGRLLAWGGDDKVYLSQGANFTLNPKPLLSLPNQNISAATLSPDGTYLVAGTRSGRVIQQRVK